MVPLTFLETLLDWKAAVDDVLVAVVGLWALLWSGGMVLVLLRPSSALHWAVAAAAVGASPPLFSSAGREHECEETGEHLDLDNLPLPCGRSQVASDVSLR